MKEILENSIESQIVFLLRNAPLRTTALIEKIQKLRPGTPKQSIYLALRKLKQKEVIALSGKMISLHEIWVTRMRRFFASVGSHSLAENSNENNTLSLLQLQKKESVSYHFNSLLSLDMFWAHAVALFMNNLPEKTSMLLYNPHEWFLIAREKTESLLIKEAIERKIPWAHLIAGKTPLDLEMRKFYDGECAQVHFLGKDIFPNNYYLNCFGEFIIEVWLDEKMTREIQNFYETHKELTPEAKNLLIKTVEASGYRPKMKISRNLTKGGKIKKVFKKYFLLK